MARPIDPFREMERLVNGLTPRATGTVSMPMNLYREGDVFVAEVELPGVDPASIDVDVEERTLTVRAERKEDPAREDRRWLTRERSAGTFARQLTLGEGLALDRIQADYSDGVLTLTIPVAEQAKPRKISVTHGGTARATLAAMLELPADSWGRLTGLDNCSWSVLVEHPLGWRLEQHGARVQAPVAHADAAAL